MSRSECLLGHNLMASIPLCPVSHIYTLFRLKKHCNFVFNTTSFNRKRSLSGVPYETQKNQGADRSDKKRRKKA